MADPDTAATEPTTTPDAAAQGVGGGIKTKLIAVAFVLVVVLAECAVAVLLFPSPDRTVAIAQAVLAQPAATEQTTGPESTPATANRDEEKEIDLGDFDVSSYQPLSNTTLRISVHLYGAVPTDDESEVLDLLEARRQRLREQVLVILRSAELTDLTDAGLGLIKRRILEKTNRVLGKPLLKQIIFSDFSFLEQ